MKLAMLFALLTAVPQQKEHKMLFKVEARNVITYIRSTSLEQAKKDYMDNLFGCLREEDVKWTVVDKVPEGEVVRE